MLGQDSCKDSYKSTEDKINDALAYCLQKYTLGNDKGIVPNDHKIISLDKYLDRKKQEHTI